MPIYKKGQNKPAAPKRRLPHAQAITLICTVDDVVILFFLLFSFFIHLVLVGLVIWLPPASGTHCTLLVGLVYIHCMTISREK